MYAEINLVEKKKKNVTGLNGAERATWLILSIKVNKNNHNHKKAFKTLKCSLEL